MRLICEAIKTYNGVEWRNSSQNNEQYNHSIIQVIVARR